MLKVSEMQVGRSFLCFQNDVSVLVYWAHCRIWLADVLLKCCQHQFHILVVPDELSWLAVEAAVTKSEGFKAEGTGL